MKTFNIFWVGLILHFYANVAIGDMSHEEKIDFLVKAMTDVQKQNEELQGQILDLKGLNTAIKEAIDKLSNNMAPMFAKAIIESFAKKHGFGEENVNEKSRGRYFFDNGFNSGFMDPYWEDITLLHIAIMEDEDEALKALLAVEDIDVNSKMEDDYTPLHVAAENGKIESMKQLLANPKIDVNSKTKYPQLTPLHLATRNDQVDSIAELLRHKDLDINAKDRWGSTALFYAQINGMKVLLNDSRIDVGITDDSRYTVVDNLKSDERHLENLNTNEGDPFWKSDDIQEREEQKNKELEEVREKLTLLGQHGYFN